MPWYASKQASTGLATPGDILRSEVPAASSATCRRCISTTIMDELALQVLCIHVHTYSRGTSVPVLLVLLVVVLSIPRPPPQPAINQPSIHPLPPILPVPDHHADSSTPLPHHCPANPRSTRHACHLTSSQTVRPVPPSNPDHLPGQMPVHFCCPRL